MRQVYGLLPFYSKLMACILILYASGAAAAGRVTGYVYDLSGNPLPQAMVSINNGANHKGPTAISVFTDARGQFSFPENVTEVTDREQPLTTRFLGYEQLRVDSADLGNKLKLTVIMRRTRNYAGSAPASAWLAHINPADKENLVNSCVGCHEVPAPEVRNYAKLIYDVNTTDPVTARKESWAAIVKYMNYISAEEFGRGASSAPPDANRVYAVGNGAEITGILYKNFTGPLQQLDHYEYGAPLAVTPHTVIMEYEVPRPNAIREALMVGSPPQLWAADVSSNRMYAIDVASGRTQIHEVPTDMTMGPHSMFRGADGSLWITPFFSAVLAHLDPARNTWQTWPLQTREGKHVGIHDLSFGSRHELLTDAKGRIWFSDIGNDGVGYIDPKTGVIETFHAPEIEGRPGSQAALYGLVMTSDRKHVWYTQQGIGCIGSFNVETLKFGKPVIFPSIHSGPRRLTIDDNDIMYVAMYGAGQLIAYDTRANRQVGIYDLPDRASAPYSATWDPLRKVVWVPTSNADAIYRFDPGTKRFSVLPLPRPGAFLRMLDVEPNTGLLVTSYANIVQNVHGPRMALIIDPGDRPLQNVKNPIAKLMSAAREKR